MLQPIDVTADPAVVRRAERIVLPGVGAFKDCRDGLKAVPGMWETLEEQVHGRGKPFLGICVGMQLMATRGLEHEVTEGFGWIPGDVKPIEPRDPVLQDSAHGLEYAGPRAAACAARRHSSGRQGPARLFRPFLSISRCDRADDVIATTDHGSTITAIVGRDNLAGTQFHPEKSQALGLALIANFLRWRP